MAFVSSTAANRLVCEALALDPKKVARLTIDLQPNTLATVTVERYVSDAELREIKAIVRKYALTPLEGLKDEV